MPSWTVARVRGIPVRIHWSLLLVLPFFAYIMGAQYFAEDGLDATSLAWGGALAATLFLSVLLHEFSHSFMAMRLGTKVRSILLMPLGGISQMESMPERPQHEFMVTVVGPLTNFIIAGPLLILHFTGIIPDAWPHFQEYVRWSGWLNVGLGAFNLFLPAFPMDGGRLLRATLAARIGRRKATQTAAAVGRVLAILMATIGFLAWGVGGIWFVLIAFFIFLGASAEERATLVQVLLRDVRARDLMTRGVDTLAPDDTLSHALDRMLETRHTAMPVADGQVRGMLTVDGLARHDRGRFDTVPVEQAMQPTVAQVAPDEPAEAVLRKMQEGRHSHVLVMEGDELIGIIAASDLQHVVQVLHAVGGRGPT